MPRTRFHAHPWIVNDPNGMLVVAALRRIAYTLLTLYRSVNDPNGMLLVAVLRRIAYTLLTLYRSVHQRSEERREMAWKTLMRWVRDTLIASTSSRSASQVPRCANWATLASLRKRTAVRLVAIAA